MKTTGPDSSKLRQPPTGGKLNGQNQPISTVAPAIRAPQPIKR